MNIGIKKLPRDSRPEFNFDPFAAHLSKCQPVIGQIKYVVHAPVRKSKHDLWDVVESTPHGYDRYQYGYHECNISSLSTFNFASFGVLLSWSSNPAREIHFPAV